MPDSAVEAKLVVRGSNPIPNTGWPWHLTDYEIAYILEFNARPVREGNLDHDSGAEARLDLEAEGVRHRRATGEKRRGQFKRWPFILAFFLLIGSTSIVAFGGVINLNHAMELDKKTRLIETEK